MVKTPRSQCRGHGLDHWSREDVALCLVQPKKKIFFLNTYISEISIHLTTDVHLFGNFFSFELHFKMVHFTTDNILNLMKYGR